MVKPSRPKAAFSQAYERRPRPAQAPPKRKFSKLWTVLQQLELTQYYKKFEQNEVSLKLLITLVAESDQDLNVLLPVIGHKRKIISYIRKNYAERLQRETDSVRGLTTPCGAPKGPEVSLSPSTSPKPEATYRTVVASMLEQDSMSDENFELLEKLRGDYNISQEQHLAVLKDLGESVQSLDERRRKGPLSKECCICLSAPPVIAFLPCGHLCVCEECSIGFGPASPQLRDEGKTGLCPQCRSSIKKLQKVF